MNLIINKSIKTRTKRRDATSATAAAKRLVVVSVAAAVVFTV